MSRARPRAEVCPGITPAGLKEMHRRGVRFHRWLDHTGKCLSCGVCTFLSTTYTAIDLVDEEGRGVKVQEPASGTTAQIPLFSPEQASGTKPAHQP